MGKLVAFKRIAVAPPPPVPVAITVPSDPAEAYAAGKKLGEKIMSYQRNPAITYQSGSVKATVIPEGQNVPTVTATSKTAPVPVAPKPGTSANPSAALDPKTGMILFKESDTGIGFKRWAIWLEYTNRWTVWTEWGHELHKQARKEMSFLSETRAKAYLASCIAAKIKRGYRRNK